jgi:hypothetical protein
LGQVYIFHVFLNLRLNLNPMYFRRSVHNVRIERLWVDVTAQVGSSWAEMFTELELRHGLDINNIHHIWLLHHLFLPVINKELAFFAESWNHHRIQIRNGPNRSPADMFGFDMLVCGVRGDQLPEEELNEEELEVYGVDWEGLHDDQLLQSQRDNNPQREGWSSWIGRVGPPEELSRVSVEPPSGGLFPHEVELLDRTLQPLMHDMHGHQVVELWAEALACAQVIRGALF